MPSGLGFGLGKLRYRTGGPGGLPPVLGFGLGKVRYLTGGPGDGTKMEKFLLFTFAKKFG